MNNDDNSGTDYTIKLIIGEWALMTNGINLTVSKIKRGILITK